MKLKEIKIIEGEIEILSGLHIGAGNDEIRIGGIDSPVIKNPLTGKPYIPGSSLKGKIRSLLEWYTESITGDARFPVWHSEAARKAGRNPDTDPILRLFGNGKTDNEYLGGPTRLSFRDCQLANAEIFADNDALFEDKVEVSIDRVKGTAAGFGPRHIERVSAAARFDFRVTCKIFDMDDGGKGDEDNLQLLIKGLKLLELDALGGSGSRGYGKVKFHLQDIDLGDVSLEN
jgi:CRISPR-associated protein Csm3